MTKINRTLCIAIANTTSTSLDAAVIATESMPPGFGAKYAIRASTSVAEANRYDTPAQGAIGAKIPVSRFCANQNVIRARKFPYETYKPCVIADC
jgi:hypothetical protein